MKRSDALKALDSALGRAIERMFANLEAGFLDGKVANEEAQRHFDHGVDVQIEAFAAASKIITAKFED